MANTRRLLTRRQLAKALGVHMQTITRWERDGMPVAEPGGRGRPSRYDRVAVKKWRAHKETIRLTDDFISLERERALKERSQRQLNEMRIAERRGELLPREQVLLEVQMMLKATAAQIRGLERRLVAMGLVPAERAAELRRVIQEILEELGGMRTMDDLKRAAGE